MGFLEYALALSFQKDYLKTRVRVNPTFGRPTIVRNEAGLDINLPVPILYEDGTTRFLGYQLPADSTGKAKVGRLFRACVFHLTAHTLMPISDEKLISSLQTGMNLEAFARSMAHDAYVNAYISSRHPDKLPDVAFANALAISKIKPAQRIFSSSTRIMAALLSKANVGTAKGAISPEEEASVNQMAARLNLLTKDILMSFNGKELKIAEALEDVSSYIVQTLETHGPILEAPSLPHTEQHGSTSVFSQSETCEESDIENFFRKSLETLGGAVLSGSSVESYWRTEGDAEASQAFDTWYHQRAKEEKILEKLKENEEWNSFRSIEFPEEDFTEYLRARTLLRGGSRRLLDSLRVAQDALDEDPGKEMGQLDLSAVIQVIASRKPATDVFMKDEYLSRSFAWSILLDVSGSMKIKSEFARAVAICIAEATKELLMDSSSWTYFAFSDRFYVLKDASEAYSQRVRARIGGLNFGGLTYMPEAIQLAGNVLSKRVDEQRFLIVISDGWPYGYENIDAKLSRVISSLQKKGVIVIGVGVETDKVKDFFKLSSVILDAKDLIRDFAKIYVNASANQLEA
jgi:Mg-chelatase subunit ChlD